MRKKLRQKLEDFLILDERDLCKKIENEEEFEKMLDSNNLTILAQEIIDFERAECCLRTWWSDIVLEPHKPECKPYNRQRLRTAKGRFQIYESDYKFGRKSVLIQGTKGWSAEQIRQVAMLLWRQNLIAPIRERSPSSHGYTPVGDRPALYKVPPTLEGPSSVSRIDTIPEEPTQSPTLGQCPPVPNSLRK